MADMNSGSVDGKPKVWFITEASSGFGRAITRYLLEKGDNVVATLRKPEAITDLTDKYARDRLLPIKLDVTKEQEIKEAFAKAKQAFGHIDVVFNNTDYCVVGEVEGTSDQVARDMFETNFWGAVGVTKEPVGFFREKNQPTGGRLLQMSSMVGLTAAPGLGFYSATQAISESLAQELDPKWNIKITLVAPGPFMTEGIRVPSVQIQDPHPTYTEPQLPGQQQREFFKSSKIYGDTAKAVIVMERLAHVDEPPVRMPLHKMSIDLARQKAKRVERETADYESWSEDVYLI
ncbi:hypothetical protein BJ138DRAFT_1085149 [Hygrophoropsis aurantiaca]|uniref:Uncharacterized protein n=1 Tax=Hygrophoropsis aurantiaca TaxID=72124 RepID=A0ACB8ADW4_9AGAM|nr:hypothetical protein BJ138DRAFT_1085149 [Hygrophoropsis aurantiaca]